MRIGACWATVILLFAGSALARPRKPSAAGVVIEHTPVRQGVLGKDLVIKSVILAPNGVYLPTLYYRLAGETQYFALPMVKVPNRGSLYASAIPGLFFTRDVEYYLEARDVKSFTLAKQAGSPDEPFRVHGVSPQSLLARVALTSDPSGAELAMDGSVLGTTPYIGDIAPGEHTFVLSKAKFKTAQRTVYAVGGRDLAVSVQLSALAKPPNLAVLSMPSQARVTLDGAAIGKTPLIHKAPQGVHPLTVWVAGYQKVQRELDFAPGRDTEIDVHLQKLPPQPVLAVVTQPAGASLSVDGTPVGKTPFLGPIATGQHELSLARKGYRGLGVQIVMPGDRDVDLRYNLEPVPANPPPPQVAFASDPAGATVGIDGKDLGKTPLIQPLSPGNHQVSLQANGFLPYHRQLWMPKDHDVEVSIALVAKPPPPGPSKVVVAVQPATAKVVVDGRRAAIGKWLGKLKAGAHVVKASAPGFRSLQQAVEVEQGQAMALTVSLTRLPPQAKAPLLTVSAEPKGTRVALDGKDLGAVPYSGEVTPGNHTVTLSAPEFKTRTETVKIPNDRTFELRIHDALAPLRRVASFAQAIARPTPPPLPTATASLAIERAAAKKSGRGALLTPTPRELAKLCVAPAKPSSSMPTAAPPGATGKTSHIEARREIVKPGVVPIVATVVGVAAAAVGGYFAIRAQNDGARIRSSADVGSAQSDIDDYHRSQTISLALFAAGGLAAGGVDIYWLLRSYVFPPKNETETASAGK